MRVIAVLNQDGGTLCTTDLEAYSAHLKTTFEAEDHAFDCVICAGSDLDAALKKQAERDIDIILAGGGDGTISAAAAIAWESKKALGVIPAGTMNLFARSTHVPLDIWDAADALAKGDVSACDIATANGRPFVHQFSVGMQPRLVHERDDTSYDSRFGKMLASTKAMLGLLARPPVFHARMNVDAARQPSKKVSMIAISNNLYGEGHLPYADRIDEGLLGVYSADVLDVGAAAKLAADLLVGTWRTNPDFAFATAKKVVLEFPRLKRSAEAVIDGELVPLEREVEISIHPGALQVLLPKP